MALLLLSNSLSSTQDRTADPAVLNPFLLFYQKYTLQ